MPVHDWKPGYAWLFHDFRAEWNIALSRQLNGGLLPSNYYALIERWRGKLEFDEISNAENQCEQMPSTDVVTVRQAEDDRLVAACELCCPNYYTGELPLELCAANRQMVGSGRACPGRESRREPRELRRECVPRRKTSIRLRAVAREPKTPNGSVL